MRGLLDGARAAWESSPSPLLALIVLALGWLAAMALRFIVGKFLLLIRFDKISERTGISEFLRKGNAKYTPSRLVGVIVYWIALLAVLLEVSRILNIGIYQALSEKLVQALPNVVAALFIVIVGSLVASFLAKVALTIALNASAPSARLISRTIKWLGIVVVATSALEQLGIGKTIVEFIFQIFLGGAAFGAALAFGLGCKDMARDYLQRIQRNLRERERSAKGPDLEG